MISADVIEIREEEVLSHYPAALAMLLSLIHI